MTEYHVVFPYRHVVGIPNCPCNDPGNYLTMLQSMNDPLIIRFICWCGRTVDGHFDDQAELDAFLIKNGGPY